jgi:DNA-binding response OmpR family regulator
MSRLTLGNLTIDRDRFEVWIGARRIDLTFVEFDLLHYLARNSGKVISRARLMQAIWKEPSRGHDRKLTVHMSRLRKKVRASEPWRIETVTKRGYVLVSDEERATATNGRAPGARRSRERRGARV